MSAAPRVEFLWWSGCPSWERALGELREEMLALGLDPASVVQRQVIDYAEADHDAFAGSPTIRIDGRDVSPTDEPVGLACRVYRLRDGRVSPLPDRADVRDALAARIPE
jgi:hypothetical protein